VPDLVVAGAGMAGLVAAAEARAHGATVALHEKLDHPGGSMRLSSGVIWRHGDWSTFREDCPDGDEVLQRLVLEGLDADLHWLESLGARVVARETGNPRTRGWRFDPGHLTDALARAAGRVRLGSRLRELPDEAPVVLATGGFPADRELLRTHVTPEAGALMLRAERGGTGDGLRLGERAGAARSAGLDQIYGRNMPAAPVAPADFVGHAQLYARHAEVLNDRGERYEPRSWSEIDVLQWTARQPGARAWFRVREGALRERVRERAVEDMVAAAESDGAPVRRGHGYVSVATVAGITSTLGGLAVDGHALAAPGVYAAGGDVGGIATGGYASGLAAALVLGRVAARSALGV
jgi:fumarate reductase flavoprotein subunit